MSGTVLPPTPEVLDAAERLDEAVEQIVKQLKSHPPSGTYEAEVEACLLAHLAVRDVEGVITLAQRDLVLLPGAICLARSGFEVAVHMLWMMKPADNFEREARWLAHIREEERYLACMAARLKELGADATGCQDHRQLLQDFRERVTKLLPNGVTPPERVPKIDDMLDEFGERRKYLMFKFGSQYVHPTSVSTGLYRRHLGTKKEFGEFITQNEWHSAFAISVAALRAVDIALKRFNGMRATDTAPQLGDSLTRAVEKLLESDSPLATGGNL